MNSNGFTHVTAGYDDKPATEAVRDRIIQAAASLIAEGGRHAATTRAVATAAAVQAPTIYRLFGDKRGLLDAVAEHGFAAYVREKGIARANPDPVRELRDGWDIHVAFGLAHPELFAIISGDPRQSSSPAFEAGLAVLRQRVRRIALAGRLKVSETRAVALLHSVGTGTILTLLSQHPDSREPGLSRAACDTVMAAITDETDTPNAAAAAAAALRASLDATALLTAGERGLMEELLDRLAHG
ncbi:TetR/AcrR family transcriptional regulator [Lichenicoccus sp.]|uniref:TetR/AcrR family transcriptional regulator n=1 Tax=Lichenicoccus sp. TaxID=2781899 RepID=UPI003D136F59